MKYISDSELRVVRFDSPLKQKEDSRVGQGWTRCCCLASQVQEVHHVTRVSEECSERRNPGLLPVYCVLSAT